MAFLMSRGSRRAVLLLGFLMLISAVIYYALHIDSHDLRSDVRTTDSTQSGTIGSGGHFEKIVVIPRLKSEDVSWVIEAFPASGTIGTAIYTVDDPSALLHPPLNKGHEVMSYLTYIIDHYESLSPITLFMHPHRHAWHNNEVLSLDAAETIRLLSPSHVQAVGYMNLRCHWQPGCPSWLHPLSSSPSLNAPEQSHIAPSWPELFPSLPVPDILAQPCCAQFAVSSARIRSHPKDKYLALRNWLIHSPLNDTISGRIFEYTWQVLFHDGDAVVCPEEHVCYCKGYGICFEGGEQQLAQWWVVWRAKAKAEEELKAWREVGDGNRDDMYEGKRRALEKDVAERQVWLRAERWKAEMRGEGNGDELGA